MSVGVVILNYNCCSQTRNLVKKIKAYKTIQKIVVVDNNSPNENEIKELETLKSGKVDVIKNLNNGGYAKGNNIGLRHLVHECHIDICIICNPDVIFEEYVVDELMEGFKNHPEFAVLGSKRVDGNCDYTQRQFWKRPSFLSELMYSTILGSYIMGRKDIYRFEENAPKIVEVDVVPGCFFAIRSEILPQIGFLDENTFLWYEENMLAEKILDIGYKEGILTCTQIVHNHDLATTKKKTSYDIFKISANSRKHYILNYGHFNKVQKIILLISLKYYLLSRKIYCFVRK